MPNTVTATETVPAKRRLPEQTIRMIMDSARREFSERGLSGAKIEAIASGARVTKQLVYHYFRSKEELYTAVLENVAEITLQDMLQQNYDELEPVESLMLFFGRMFDQHVEWPNLATLMMDENIHRGEHLTLRHAVRTKGPDAVAKLEKILQRGMEKGLFRTDLNAKVVFPLGQALILGCFTNGYSALAFVSADVRPEDTYADWRRYALNFLLSALRP